MDKITKIEIRVGSDSDFPKIQGTFDFLKSLGISYKRRILSAHRTPDPMMREAQLLEDKGYSVSIAAAGGSAALPGMTASETLVPVVGLPVETIDLGGMDSLPSIIQMPEGVPVGSVGIGQAESAAILAIQIAYVDNVVVRNMIREKRGIERELHIVDNGKNLVGFIGSSGNKGKYNEFRTFSEGLGLNVESFSNKQSVRDYLKNMEDSGAKAVVVFGTHVEFDSTINLPKTISQYTDLPVIGVPLSEGDKMGPSDLSTMLCSERDEEKPIGYPVAGMGSNRVRNAALYAAQICGIFNLEIRSQLRNYRETKSAEVEKKDASLQRK